jgi:GT2 family glycosyltransferase
MTSMEEETAHDRHSPHDIKHVRASVILVSYNSWPDLQACLESLLRSLSGDDEVIVVDNSPQDGTLQLIESHYPWVRGVRSSENDGYGGGNNLGAQYAQGQYLVFLNPDTTVEPGWLAALVRTLETDPTIGLATSKILLLHDPQHINTCGNKLHLSGLTLCRGLGQSQSTFNSLEVVSAVSGAAFIIRRDLYDALRGFDETFFMYMEDTDLSWRARLLGYRSMYVPDSLVYHDYALCLGPRKTFYQERNRYLMLLKSLRWRTLFLLLPALFLAELVTWGFALMRDRGHLGNKIQAYVWIGRHWRVIRAQRQQIQSNRQVPDWVLVRALGYQLDFEQAAGSWVAHLSHWVFDPAFYAWQRVLTLTMVW